MAEAAMLVLSGTLGLFWLFAPRYLPLSQRLRQATQTAGVLALLASSGLLTSLPHDLITNTASLLGVVATAGIFAGLHGMQWRKLHWLGWGNILLVGVNNLFYYDQALIVYLPVVQKLTFAAFLLWVCGVSVRLYRQASTPASNLAC